MKISAIIIFPSESSWGVIYVTFGNFLFIIGLCKLTRNINLRWRILLIAAIFIGSLAILLISDYINVRRNNVAPMIRISTLYLGSDDGDLLYYDTPFYDVIKCDVKNGKDFKIVKNKHYTNEDLYEYCSKKAS